ncbi:hybrid-cluster NAD(P)-dependent oxidoreductase [Kineococcus aurantiacus]|uniref:Ferredoxin-NADP reductase n=1 Tax=Kineococcus aurantiacus TaxID=37633 RepID=A0A7Y9DQA9_9ACTN|nr:hybrid-cluster NAD(P)-dependent oxidoreductase [Kineococcus aurantiacus]NYD24850.1 ferredoxin-NADP reductase [Kineococcus aurantiacus]
MTVVDPLGTLGHPGRVGVWGDEEDSGELVCLGVRDITHDVKTFWFESAGGHVFFFDPGQFITLHLDVDGQRVERSYTISSPPTRPHRLAITVKRQPGGLVSNWLHDHVVPGTRLTASAPLGAFSVVRHPARKYLFLSAGSGITPVMSMTRTLVDLGSDVDVLFVHSARTPADIIFRSEQWGMPTQFPTVNVVQVCSADAPGQDWRGHRGRLDQALLAQVVPDLQEREVFVCGPEGYMSVVREALRDAGFDMTRYHEETFVFESLGPSAFAGSVAEGVEDIGDFQPSGAQGADGGDAEQAVFTVSMAASGRSFPCAPDEFILDAAFRAGISPPSSCSQGMCGTCKTVLLSGEVDMQHNGGIRPREIAAGKVLICCSKPLGDVSLDR